MLRDRGDTEPPTQQRRKDRGHGWEPEDAWKNPPQMEAGDANE
jgi:hypothetical protein